MVTAAPSCWSTAPSSVRPPGPPPPRVLRGRGEAVCVPATTPPVDCDPPWWRVAAADVVDGGRRRAGPGPIARPRRPQRGRAPHPRDRRRARGGRPHGRRPPARRRGHALRRPAPGGRAARRVRRAPRRRSCGPTVCCRRGPSGGRPRSWRTLVPDAEQRAAIAAECPATPRALYDEPVPVPDRWPGTALCGYLSFTYEDDAAEAQRRRVDRGPGRGSPPPAGRRPRGRGRPDRAAAGCARRRSVTRHAALVGVTASGKSALALELARRLPGIELVSIDSMQVYRGMDIGTAKPTPAERAEVPHHLLDLADPTEEFTVARFQRAFRAAIADIESRGHRALLVGGTGLYLRGRDRRPRHPRPVPGGADRARGRARHRRRCTPGCVGSTRWPPRRMEPTNRRRVVRALEVTLGSGRPFSSFGPGLGDLPAEPVRRCSASGCRGRWWPSASPGATPTRSRPASSTRCAAWPRRGSAAPPAQALGYKELLAHLAGECTEDEAIDLAVRRTRRFARRQRVWFQRDPRITWVGADDDPTVALPALHTEIGALRPRIARRIAPISEGCGASGCENGRNAMTTLRLSKHHGLGNDFLVLLDQAADARLAERLCDRRTGVGADGLLIGHGRRAGRRRPHDGALQRRRVTGRDERQRHPLPGPGLGARAARPRATCASPPTPASARSPGRGHRRPGRRRRPASTWARPCPAPTSAQLVLERVAGRSPSTWATRTSCSSWTTSARRRRRRRAVHREAGVEGGINVEWIAPADRRATASTSGCGSGAPATRWPAAPAPARPPTRRTPGAWSASGSRWPWRAATCRCELGDTITLVGPATHVADVEVAVAP